MKKILFTLIALVLSVGSYAQLISNKTDNKVTFGFDLFSDIQLKPSENWDPRGFNQGFSCALTYNFPLAESKVHTVSLGVGMTSHNYFSYSRIDNPYLTSSEPGLTLTQMRGEEGFKRYKIAPTYVDIPLELKFRINDAWKIGVGFKFGIRVGTRTRYVGYDENSTHIDVIQNYIPNTERFAYSGTLRVGYRWISLFGAFQFNRVFELGHNAPEFMPLSVGISIAPF